ncbi:MAG TPA: S46 family peptidase [Flavipsychrobacter sp.]|nr:S46 family peptidase [Flavipsychrobacter sp.]
MKKLLLSLVVACTLVSARADEGMWLPYLIGKNYEDMKRLGLKLTKADLYSINNSSLKDAIVQFNGGCTAEIISGSGLLLTNHHCGYGTIAGLSTVEKNYLDNGFWAKNKMEELPSPNMSVIFLQKMEDVTDEVMQYVGKATAEEYAKKFNEIATKIEKRASKEGKYVANVKEFFNGNQIILLTYKRFTDVRLVGTPPKSLGKYGGDTDNWMWPRHTADFSMFRVYANADNEPAPYSASNVPYVPKKFLPVSIKGVKEGDYAMIMGYPGRTNRYEVASGVNQAINEVNPSIVKIREERLAIMRKNMDADKSVYLKLTASYQRISNYWKYFIGQTEQLKRNKVVAKKERQEARFNEWASENDNEFEGLLNEYNSLYKSYEPYAKHVTYYTEAFRAPVLNRVAAAMVPLAKAMQRGVKNEDSLKKYIRIAEAGYKAALADYDATTDKELFAAMTKMYYSDVASNQLPAIYESVIFKKHKKSNLDKAFQDYTDEVYKSTFLLNNAKMESFFKKPSLVQLEKDAAYKHASSYVLNYEKSFQQIVEDFYSAKKELSKKYVRGLMQMKEGKLFYPDANSTMRITYGQVLDYSPQDGVLYDYYTTIDGLMSKYKAGDAEFDLPQDFIDLYQAKDYGRYADKTTGKLHTCFISNNDITGGNSGSPVINGNGELIGLAFDGNWEAMSGDIAFDKKYKRTISVDARFVLFIIEKLGKAPNLIKEMDIRE